MVKININIPDIKIPYKTKKHAFILRNMGIGDMIVTTGLVEYVSKFYESVMVLCRSEFVQFLYRFHHHNNKIKHYTFDKNFADKSGVGWAFPKENVDILRKTHDIIAIGHYSATGNISVFPSSYYDDAGIPFEFMKTYVKIVPYIDGMNEDTVNGVVIPKEIMDIYKELFFTHEKYIVVHQEGSTCNMNLIQKCMIDINDMLVIDVNKNVYPNDHKWHNIAEKFVNFDNPMWYKLLLENAYGLCLVDSCIHALSYLCDISKVKQKVCYSRAEAFPYVDAGFKYIQTYVKRINGQFVTYYADPAYYNPFWKI